ncbi:hypothetical protein [Methylobacterium nonmethylotrophicum]|uniref:Uncharacterized protein n=1 Tax=Methylobacterium nonmethylotrophicum TaxID=1141884 RepID=A0A4Z0NEH6_9HYPH|nr:hypothetical protein [Methylobacterium nonmethylotrophicum]TGD93744.1 hypothetical protein EU555_33220 [Methylobacterium nonmethylotrophicum]
MSLALALLTVLPSRRAIVTSAAALLAAPVAKAPAAAAAPVLALPAPVAVADPILSAIRAHRRAWAVFQVAPDEEAEGAEHAEYEAAMRLLGTACSTRPGAHALIAHLRWYMAEERDNLLTCGLGGCDLGDLVRARLAELVLLVPEASPPAVIALPACRPSPLLAAIEDHRSANLAVSQAVRDYVEAQDNSAPDEPHLLAIADRASDVEVAALNALLALTPANSEEVSTLAAYLAEVSTDFDKGAFGAWLFQRFAVMIAAARAQA